MAAIPTFSPHIPFLGLISGGLTPGRSVRINGVMHSHGERCEIHIQSGSSMYHRNDVTLYISIRPNEQAIVRNSIQNHVSGPEERYGGCPIHYGVPFDMMIVAEASQYRITINGGHFCTFPYRLSVYSGQYISVSGGCTIHSIVPDGVSGPGNPFPPPIGQHPPYVPPTGVFVPNVPTYPGGPFPGAGFPPSHPEYPQHPPPGTYPPATPF